MKKTFYYSILVHLVLKKIKRNFKLFYLLPIFVLGISSLDNFYLISLFNSLSFQIIIALLVFSILLMILKKHQFAIISFASALYLLASISVFDNPHNSSSKNSDNFSVSHYNVLKTNKNYDTIINSALNSNSDIISFQEISSDWKSILINKLKQKYPYYIIKDDDKGFFGIALFSKQKIINPEIVYIEGVPNIFASIETNNSVVDIITSHTNSPINLTRFNRRNKHINYLSKKLKEKKNPLLVIGDFNAVPWDSRIVNFKNNTKLIDSRNSLSSTWPRQLGYFGIPLDYIFHSKNITCEDFQVIDKSSSDHCGIKGVYSIDLQQKDNIVLNNIK